MSQAGSLNSVQPAPPSGVALQQVRAISNTSQQFTGAINCPTAGADVAPTSTDGDFLISLDITPVSSSSVIVCEFYCSVFSQGESGTVFFLIQSNSSNSFSSLWPTTNSPYVYFSGFFTSGTTSTITISCRVGNNRLSDIYILKSFGGGHLGGTASQYSLIATEYAT